MRRKGMFVEVNPGRCMAMCEGAMYRVHAPEVLKIQGFSEPFHSIIQGQFNALLPVNHSIAYSPTDTQEKRCTDLKH